MLLKLICLLSR